jgi:hypothetical protein
MQRSIDGRTHHNSNNLDWLSSIENLDCTSLRRLYFALYSRKLGSYNYFAAGNASYYFAIELEHRCSKHSLYSYIELHRFCQIQLEVRCIRSGRLYKMPNPQLPACRKETSEYSSFFVNMLSNIPTIITYTPLLTSHGANSKQP